MQAAEDLWFADRFGWTPEQIDEQPWERLHWLHLAADEKDRAREALQTRES